MKIAWAGELKANILSFRMNNHNMLLFSYMKLAPQVASSVKSYDIAMKKSYAGLDSIRGLTVDPHEIAALDETHSGVDAYRIEQLKVQGMLQTATVEEAADYDRAHLTPIGARLVAAIDAITAMEERGNQQAEREANTQRSRAEILIGLCVLLTLPVGVVVWLVMNKTTRQLAQTAERLEASAANLDEAAERIVVSGKDLASSAAQQAVSLEQTSASGDAVGSMADQNAVRTKSASGFVQGAREKFESTNALLEEMVGAMDEIERSSGKVSQVIRVIEEIAFQTNLLALNAAVEAARAGDSGLGFAVVADEVRSLAQRSAGAAKETTSLIDESIANSKSGKLKVTRVADAIRAVSADIGEVQLLIDQVSQGSRAQVTGIASIGKAITDIGQTTKGTARMAQGNVSAGAALETQSSELKEMVERLTEIVGRRAA